MVESYKTIERNATATYRVLGSKFITYAYVVSDALEAKEYLEALRREHYNATHCCYAYRLGFEGDESRSSDDGEPSGTAGKPILGQLLSAELTNILVVVVRYFGGTKLGVSGLIDAYRQSTIEVIDAADVVLREVRAMYEVRFGYLSMNDVMRVVKECECEISEQQFDNLCTMTLGVVERRREFFEARIEKCEGVGCEFKEYN